MAWNFNRTYSGHIKFNVVVQTSEGDVPVSIDYHYKNANMICMMRDSPSSSPTPNGLRLHFYGNSKKNEMEVTTTVTSSDPDKSNPIASGGQGESYVTSSEYNNARLCYDNFDELFRSIYGENVTRNFQILSTGGANVSNVTLTYFDSPCVFAGENEWGTNIINADQAGITKYTNNNTDGKNDINVLFASVLADNYLDPNWFKFQGVEWTVFKDGKGKKTMSLQFLPTLIKVGEIPSDFRYTLLVSRAPVVDGTLAPYEFTTVVTVKGGQIDSFPFSATWIDFRSDHNLDTTLADDIGFYVSYIDNQGTRGVIGAIVPYNADTVSTITVLHFNDDKSDLILKDGFSDSDDDQNYDDLNLIDSGIDKSDPNAEPSDTIERSAGYNTHNILTTTYAMTEKRLQSLGHTLWSSGFFDNIQMVNNNPIENIIAVKAFPFNMSGTTKEIRLGNVLTGVNGEVLSRDYSYRHNIGSLKITKRYNNFLDYEPFTKVSIYLPFIGYKDLVPSQFIDKTLEVEYVIDIVTGACKALIYSDNKPLLSFDGSMGIDIPLTSSNRAQVEAGYLSSIIDVGMSALGGNPIEVAESAVSAVVKNGMSQYHSQQGGGVSPACSAYQSRDCFVIYDRPTYENIPKFAHTHGRVCMITRTIGTLSGFTQTSNNVDLSGLNCLDEEKEMIRSLLSTGFFI